MYYASTRGLKRVFERILKSCGGLQRNQRGMSGLETAIILIAFVTVASVLAYSVLSAGVFSAERGKETMYGGLASAEATMNLVGSVLGLSPNQAELEQIQFNVGLTLDDQKVDMDSIVIRYFDAAYETQLSATDWSSSISSGSVERGAASLLERDEVHEILITIPAAANVGVYEEFTILLTPPTGATLAVKRRVGKSLSQVMDLY